MSINPFTAILIIAALPAALVSLRTADGWRTGIIFAAFYPALVVLIATTLITVLMLLSSAGLFDLD